MRQSEALMIPPFRFAVLLLASAVVVPLSALATEVEGGGTPSSDCWVTFDSTPSVNYPVSRPRSVRCADQDATCGDTDARVGYCTFGVNLILNSSQFMPACMPTALSGNDLLIPYMEPQNDDHPKHSDDLQVFQNFINAQLPTVTSGSRHDVASGLHDVSVPLGIRFTGRGPAYRTTTVTVQTTMCPVPIHNETFCPTAPKDVDKFQLICTPPIDPSTGKPLSACTGADGNPITSTFQQIQEHIFDRKCSNLSACHGSMMQAGMCLAADCGGGHGSYADLVGHAPMNPAANADGLQRVDPGSPTNSLIVHKITGGGQLEGPSGSYGLRMPYNNPAIGKTRPKLTRAEIQLITDWITAGAPMNGFIPTTAAGACH